MTPSDKTSVRPGWQKAFEAFLSSYFSQSYVDEVTSFAEELCALEGGLSEPLRSRSERFRLDIQPDWQNTDLEKLVPHIERGTERLLTELLSAERDDPPNIEISVETRKDRFLISIQVELELF